jgi:hypothetical protein
MFCKRNWDVLALHLFGFIFVIVGILIFSGYDIVDVIIHPRYNPQAKNGHKAKCQYGFANLIDGVLNGFSGDHLAIC